MHFSCLLNCPSHVTDDTIASVQQRPIISELDTPPSMEETTRAVGQIRAGKGSRSRWYSHRDIQNRRTSPPGAPDKAVPTVLGIWAITSRPSDANIIHPYRNKGDRSSCDNHCGISLRVFQAKSWPEFYSTVSPNTCWMTWCQSANVLSERIEEQWIWFLPSVSYKRNVSSNTRTSTYSSSTWPRLLTQWTVRHSGQYSTNLDAHLSSSRLYVHFTKACLGAS